MEISWKMTWKLQYTYIYIYIYRVYIHIYIYNTGRCLGCKIDQESEATPLIQFVECSMSSLFQCRSANSGILVSVTFLPRNRTC